MGCHNSKDKGQSSRQKSKDLENWSSFDVQTPAAGRGRQAGRRCEESRLEQFRANSENEEYRDMMTFLQAVPLFQRLPKDQAPILASAVVMQRFQPGQIVIKQGDVGHEIFVIRSGKASACIDGKEVCQLKGGDYFGEGTLLRDQPQRATIRSMTKLSTMRIHRKKFQELRLHERLHFGHRNAVGGNVQVATRPPSQKTENDRRLMKEAISRNKNLQNMVLLDDLRMQQIIDVAWTESIPSGQEIIEYGDPVANYFYIVKSGRFDFIKFIGEEAAKDWSKPHALEEVIKTHSYNSMPIIHLGVGESFGETALLFSQPRSATVKAQEDSVVWVIDRLHFKEILMSAGQEQDHQKNMMCLKSVPVLSGLSYRDRTALAMAMTEMHFQRGDQIIHQGDIGNNFYILFDGEVAVVKDGVETVRLKAEVLHRTTGKAHYFGERALITRTPREATIEVTSLTAKAMALDKEAFTILLGPLEKRFKHAGSNRLAEALCAWAPCVCDPGGSSVRGGLLGRRRDDASSHETARRKVMQRAVIEFKESAEHILRPVRRKDLETLGLLGAGAFGIVELVEHRVTGKTFALKCLSKGHIVSTGMKQSVMSERCILMMTHSPFIIALHETYNGYQTLYFLMEPALGGELAAIYWRNKLYGSIPHARYYVGGVIFAFAHLHERRIIYRDLKPENLVLNERGHLKLVDMGFAKFVIGKTYTTCGTPSYFAPEVIRSQGHNFAVDWWTLGILLFELMVGKPPFEAPTPEETLRRVMKGLKRERYPRVMNGRVGDLVDAILQHDPPDRLPMRPGGVGNLKAHPWYEGFDWAALESLQLPPPHLPVVQGDRDTGNFQVHEEDLPLDVPYRDDGSGWDKDFASST